MSRVPPPRSIAKFTAATTSSVPRVPGYPTCSAEANPRSLLRTPTENQFLMIRIVRRTPPARDSLPSLSRPKRRRTKRKRVLCRRFLVSLEVRRRTPTSLSRITKETRHDWSSNGVFRYFSPRLPDPSLYRPDQRRLPQRIICSAHADAVSGF